MEITAIVLLLFLYISLHVFMFTSDIELDEGMQWLLSM